MKTSSSSYLVICTGYNPADYRRIRDHLISSGFFSVICGKDIEELESHDVSDADVILTGFLSSCEEISKQIQQYRSVYPGSVIIRCINVKTPDPDPYPLLPLFDGYFQLDPDSLAWGFNLVGIICQAIKTRHQQSLSYKRGYDIYREIFENNSIPIALTEPETGRFIEVNRSFLRLYGYSREEVIGKTSVELNLFISKENRDRIFKECTENYPSGDMEISFRSNDNQIIRALFSVDIIVHNGKEFYLSTIKDITSLKQIETELKDKNRFIEDILSGISEGIVVYDIDLKYLVWNKYMEILTGVQCTEVLGKPAHVYFPEFKGDNVLLLLERTLHGVTSKSSDVFFSIPWTGKTGWISIIYTPYRDSSGNIIGVIGSIRDISDRKYAENKIIAHEMLLRSIIDTVPFWIICIDTDGIITLANTGFSSSFGLSPDMIEGHLYEDFYISKRFEHHNTLIQKALSGRETIFNEEMDGNDSSSHKKYLRGVYSPLKSVDGKVLGVICVINDITDLKIAQKTIENINSKLHLLSSITRHDILNSLTGVLGYLVYIEDEKDPNLLRSYVNKAYQIALLIKEQIEFTRDYQDLGVKEPTWQNVRTVFSGASKKLKFGDIKVEVSLDNLLVYADPLLERVIYNLIDNAIRYGQTITRISSYWYMEANHIIWVIEDNGAGISPNMKDRVFRKGVGHNTGLGLFLAREILDISGLSIYETGIEGKGARFEILIPNGLWQITKDT